MSGIQPGSRVSDCVEAIFSTSSDSALLSGAWIHPEEAVKYTGWVFVFVEVVLDQ
jgi:hypothetical protein